jgi:hypothetical protein
LLNQSWQVQPTSDEVNWPDLFVTEETCTFGLEVREVYIDETTGGSPKKALEAHNRKSIAALAKDYYMRSSVPIKLNLLGGAGEEQDLLHLLADEAARLCVWERKRFEAGDGCVAYVTRLPEEFQGYSRWTSVSDQVGWVVTIDQALLESVIKKKAEKLEKYRENISDVRLLIVSDRIYNSGKARTASTIQCQSYGFSAVYYMSFPEEALQIVS